ncbi:MAG: hypothetical protein LLG37_04150, partial [Spirochaetia bacterium]|nr:hypothetical protein [Spirochaetia bacterium]
GVNHFSEFVVLTDLQKLCVEKYGIKPNPFSPENGPVNFTYLLNSTESSSVKTSFRVFNLAGKHIRHLVKNELKPVGIELVQQWDGRDDRGRMCLNGRYFLQLEIEDASGKRQYVYSIALVK